MTDPAIEAREAQQGEKKIEVKLRFWTSDIAEGGGILIAGIAADTAG